MIDEERLRVFAGQYLNRLYQGGANGDDLRSAQFWMNDFFRKAYDIGLLSLSIEPTLPAEANDDESDDG